jgi:hypothetical protein
MDEFSTHPEPDQFPFHTNGTTAYSQAVLDDLTPADQPLIWETLDPEDQLEIIFTHCKGATWFERCYLDTFVLFRPIPWEWARIKAIAKERGVNPWDLEKAVDAIRKAEQVDLQDAQKTSAQESITPTRRPVIMTMSEVEAQPIEWLWWPYLAVGKIAMLDGDPGIGKSLLMTQIAASLSRGYPLPDQQGRLTLATGSPQSTLLLSTEDGLGDTLKPRLVAAEADCSKVHVLTGWLDPQDAVHAFTLEHLDVLSGALREYQPRLVVIDPIQAYLGNIDMHRANETRPLLTALAALAEQHRCAVVCIRHPGKPGQGASGKAIHRGLGSVDFIATARTGLFVEQHPVDPGKVLLSQHKSNIGVYGRTQVFSKNEGQFHWCGVTRLTVEMFAGNKRGPDPMAFVEAFCWLEERLAGGLPLLAEDIEAEALEAEHKKDTVYRAKQKLGVVSQKIPGQQGKWTWRLPDLTVIPPPVTTTVSSVSSLTTLASVTAVPCHTLRDKGSETRTTGQDGVDMEDTEERVDMEDRVVIVEGKEDSNVSTPLSEDTRVSGDTGVSDLDTGGEGLDTAVTPWNPAMTETPETPGSRAVQDGVSDTVCPQCSCEHLMDCLTYVKCPLCSWQGS